MLARRLRTLCLIAAVALLAACSSTQLLYNQLDVLARWRVNQYVSMNDAQRTQFDRAFASVWDWHRQHELPRYAAALREIAAHADTPPDAAALEKLSDEYGGFWTATLDRLLPIGCTLGARLSDAQVAQLLKRVDRDIDTFADKEVDPPLAKHRKHTQREIEKSLRKWLGDVTPAQQDFLRTWIAASPPADEAWLAFRRHWREQLAQTLQARTTPAFCTQLDHLVRDGDALWTPSQQQVFADNRRHWIELFATLGPMLSDSQRQTLRKKVSALADDLDALAAAPR